MSIYVYVTRKPDPLDDVGPEISKTEWMELVRTDPELELRDPEDKSPSDRTIYAAWDSYPGGYTAWFGFAGGSIEVKGMDEALLSKLRAFSSKLGARIVSEEGEEFA